MFPISRRRLIYDLGILSASLGMSDPVLKAIGGLWLPQGASTSNESDYFYLIVSGSWIVSVEWGNRQIRLVTPDAPDHIYDYTVTTDANPNATALGSNIIYTVTVKNPSSAASSSDLVKAMVSGHQGFIFNNKVKLDTSNTPNLRTVLVPIPTFILPAAILSGPIISVDSTITQSSSVTTWPLAYVFAYSGNWASAQMTDANGTVAFSLQQGNPAHVRLRVCQKGHCDPTPARTLDCAQISAQESHVHTVFQNLLSMLQFPEGSFEPTISFPACGGSNSHLKIAKGANGNIQETEVGLPPPSKLPALAEKMVFANLHNCAASGMIVGA